jgi:predicted  nucleic acid-binding Zn-ribbon protein
MHKAILIFAAFLAATSPAQAKDVSAQQVGLEYARENLENAEKKHKANLQQVADSEKRLSEAQKQLEENRLKTQASKKTLDEANAKFIKAQELLDRAWKE